jgi:hypothetical protein
MHILQNANATFPTERSNLFSIVCKIFDTSALKISLPGIFVKIILSRVLVTNNAGSGLDERVYLLLIHTTSNYT